MESNEILGIGTVYGGDHIGDGVYLGVTAYHYVIFTYDGMIATNVVCLEHEVWEALKRQIPRQEAIAKELRA
jgi:hypothetical protein